MQLAFATVSEGLVVNQTALNVTSAGHNTTYLGFGEHENGKLDQAGQQYDMRTCLAYDVSKGGEVCLPWIMVADTDSEGHGKQFQFGLLWNNGAYGGVTFGTEDLGLSKQQWVGDNLDQVDILLTTYSRDADPTKGFAAPNSILHHYVDAVGHAPPLPAWASGY